MCGESLVRIPFVDILGKFTAYPSISVCQSFLYDTTNYEMLFSGKQARKVISTLNQCSSRGAFDLPELESGFEIMILIHRFI